MLKEKQTSRIKTESQEIELFERIKWIVINQAD